MCFNLSLCFLQAALKEAKESLDETIKLLNDSKARLREVEEGIAALQSKYEECVAKKEELKDKCDLCAARLTRAEKVRRHSRRTCVYAYYVIWLHTYNFATMYNHERVQIVTSCYKVCIDY